MGPLRRVSDNVCATAAFLFCPFGTTVELHLSVHWLSGTPLIRIGLILPVYIFSLYLLYVFLGLKFTPIFSNTFEKLCISVLFAVCRIFFSTSNCQFSLFLKKTPIIRISCISGCLAVPVNPDKWSSAASYSQSVCSQAPVSLCRLQ